MGMYTKWAVRVPLRADALFSSLKAGLAHCERGDQVVENLSLVGGVLEGCGEMKNYDDELGELERWVIRNVDIDRVPSGSPVLIRWYEEDDFPNITVL